MSARGVIRPSGYVPAVMADREEDGEIDERFMGPPVSLTAWSHEPSRLNEDVIVDMSLIPNAREGDVAEFKTTSDRPKRLYFIVKRLTDEQAKAMPNVQVSTSLNHSSGSDNFSPKESLTAMQSFWKWIFVVFFKIITKTLRKHFCFCSLERKAPSVVTCANNFT